MMKRTIVVLTTATVVGVVSSVAGAASSGPRTEPIRYAPDSGSVHVYSSSGKKLGTLTGDRLNTQFVSVVGGVSQ
jgi:hypothetical protein